MRLLVVVFLHKVLPILVGFLQRHPALGLAFLLVGINQTVIHLDFPLLM
jgi:hypothetical protein